MGKELSGIFVGRQKELAELVSAVSRASDGIGGIALVAGEPGIGKTTLFVRAIQGDEKSNFSDHWGHCTEHSGAPALWPWTQAIRSLARTISNGLGDRLDPEFPDLRELIPELTEKSGLPATPQESAPAESEFRLFESVTRFLSNATADQPLVLVLEDLHWADQLSLGLLAHLAPVISSMPLLVIGTYRDVELSRAHPLAGTLAQLHSFDMTRVSLQPLLLGESSALLESLSGQRHEKEIAGSIHNRSGGNPLFVSELARSIGSGRLDPASERVPEGVKEAIGQRLNQLSQECNRFLQDCSLIDSSFDVQLLSLLFPDSSTDQLLDLIEEGERNGFLQANEAGRNYEFSHALFRQTLATELSIGSRVKLHGRIGHALLDRYGDEADDHAEELAVHFMNAEALIGPGQAVRFSILAGEHALESFAYADASRHFTSAGELLDGEAPDTEIAIKYGLGRALTASHLLLERAEGWRNLVAAFDLSLAAGQTERALRISMYPAIFGGLENVPEFYQRAIELAEAGSFEYGWLKARYGVALSDTGAVDSGKKHIEEAIELARSIGNDRLAARANAHLLQNRQRAGDHTAVVDLYQEVMDLARPIGDYGSITRIGSMAVISLAALGRADEAKLLLDQVKPMRVRMGAPEWIASIIDDEASLARLTGDWDLFKAASEELSRYDFRGQVNLAILEYMLEGKPIDPDALLDAADKAIVGGEGRAYWTLVGAAGIAMDAGEIELLQARRIGEQHFRFHDNPENRLRFLLADAFIVIAEEDSDFATALLNQLQHISGRAHPDLNVSGDRVLARLSALTDDANRTRNHYEAALAFCRSAGYLPELVHTCADFSEWSVSSKDEDFDRVRAVAEEGLGTATRLGMRPLIERLESVLEQISAASPQLNPDGLSDREVEVLALVGTGRSNQEIADELFISRYTVVRHVANIYDKTGVTNRSEATNYALRNGLTPDS